MNKDSRSLLTAAKYDKIANSYDRLIQGSEQRWFAKWRKQYFSTLTGKILEVGIGTGNSIPFYNKEARITGIDFSQKMLEKARRKLAQSGRKNITLKHMDAEHMSFKDNTFDYAITSCVFCSVPNPVRGLIEIRRVLKPGGKLIMLEHVLSKNPIIAILQHALNPITQLLLGEHINRNTRQNIIQAGLKVTKEKNLALADIFRLLTAQKNN